MEKTKTEFYDSYHDQNKNKRYFSVISENNFTYFYTQKYLKKVLKLVQRKELDILDLGCGVGAIDFYLAQKGHRLTGIDISKEAIDICNSVKEQFDFEKTTFIHGDVAKVDFKKKFDVVICSEVIEHVEDDKALLQRIHELLKENGVVLVTTPSLNAPLYRLGLLADFDQRVGHLRRYRMEGLVKSIRNSNLKIIEMAKTESILRNGLYTFRYVGYLIKLIRGPLVPIFHVLDALFVKLIGESDLVVIAQKE